ncbi:MAG: hypothetical protein V1779_15010 [bacterium]
MKHILKMQKILFFFAIIITTIGLIQCTQKNEEVPAKEKVPPIIVSTVEGGDWADVSTWQQGLIPTSESDVNICGKVIINGKAECLNLMVDNRAILEVMKDASLIVKHHIINEGSIVNNGEIIVREKTHK